MWRLILLLLVLANLLFFVWAQGWLGTRDEGREPQRLSQQIEPEKLQTTIADPKLADQTAESCRLVRGLAPSDMQRLLLLAQEKFPNLRFALKNRETPSYLYWVFIPPQPNKFMADRKLFELKSLAVTNAAMIQDEGQDKYAISLGLFETEQLASVYLQDLQKRGVKSAKLQTRENLLDKAQLEARGPAEILARQLPELIGGQPSASLGDCGAGRELTIPARHD
ncbi:MAG: hypothetical protein WC100_05430 [Sterolibacterium sp.]